MYIGENIGQQFTVEQRFVLPLRVDQRELATDDVNIDIRRSRIREIHFSAQRQRNFIGCCELIILEFE